MSIPHSTDAKKDRNQNIAIDYSKVRESGGKHVYEYYDSKMRKKYVFCAEIQQKMDCFGNYFYSRCSYNAENNHFKFNHICSFEIILPADFHLPAYFFEKPTLTDKRISDLVGQLVIETGLSFHSSTGSAFKHFVTEILKTGYNISAKKLYN